MQFKDIVGQKEVKAKLIKSVKDGRIAHAQLLVGQAGTGKLALAIAYAQFISCKDKQEDDSCGKCSSCHKFQKLIHPDLHFVFPVNKDDDDSKGAKSSDSFIQQWRETILGNPYISESLWYSTIGIGNKLGIISTSESSEVIKKLSLTSVESEYKTMIIWLPERMNDRAANKLLKLIEEPPSKTIFLMVTEHQNLIIQTILSRTQIIRVPPIEQQDIAEALVSRWEIDAEKANSSSRIANGNYQRAIDLVRSEESNPYFPYFQEIMRVTYSKNIPNLFGWVEKMGKLGRKGQQEMIQYSLRLIRESFMLNLGLDDIAYIAESEMTFCKNFSPFINAKNIQQVYQIFNEALEHISRNGNPQIIFTDMSLRLSFLINPK